MNDPSKIDRLTVQIPEYSRASPQFANGSSRPNESTDPIAFPESSAKLVGSDYQQKILENKIDQMRQKLSMK